MSLLYLFIGAVILSALWVNKDSIINDPQTYMLYISIALVLLSVIFYYVTLNKFKKELQEEKYKQLNSIH